MLLLRSSRGRCFDLFSPLRLDVRPELYVPAYETFRSISAGFDIEYDSSGLLGWLLVLCPASFSTFSTCLLSALHGVQYTNGLYSD
jgi:hypothetical protein